MSTLIPVGMDSVTGIETIANGQVFRMLGGINSSGLQSSGALPTTTFVSGTGKQVVTANDFSISIPVTFNPTGIAVASCLVELSPDNVTYSTLVTVTYPALAALLGLIEPINIPNVRAGYYIRLTVTNATLGTATYW